MEEFELPVRGRLPLCWFLSYILARVPLVFITGARVNLNITFGGVNGDTWSGVLIFVTAMVLVAATWCLASRLTLRHARRVQQIGAFLARPFNGVS